LINAVASKELHGERAHLVMKGDTYEEHPVPYSVVRRDCVFAPVCSGKRGFGGENSV
jgi:hypothetical protein